MSATSGGTAPNPCRTGGSWSLDAGSGAIVAVFSMQNLPLSRHQVQIEPSRFVVSITTPRNPYSRTGSCAGRTSRAIWWLVPRSVLWVERRAPRVTRLLEHLLVLDDLVNSCLSRIGLRIYDVDT